MAASFEELTEDEQALLLNFLKVARALIGEQIRLNTKLENAKAYYTAHITSIMAQLDNDAIIIPNDTGLAGAKPLTKGQVASVLSVMNNILTYNTQANRDLADACVGTVNITG